MLDPDTSDHEFIQNEAEVERESDACSDLDELEGLQATRERSDDGSSRGAAVEGDPQKEVEGESEGDVEGDSEGELPDEGEMDGYSAGEESDGGGYFSDNDDIPMTFGRSSKKQRLLDSDDEEEEDGGSRSSTEAQPHKDSSVLKNSVPPKPVGVRRASVLGEEPSMGPLMLNESFECESENTNSVAQDAVDVGGSEGRGGEDVMQSVASQSVVMSGAIGQKSKLFSVSFGLPAEGMSGPASTISGTTATLQVPSLSSSGGGEKLPVDSGVGASLAEEIDLAGEREVEHENERDGEEEDREGAPTQAMPDSDRDNSLESSLLWAPSLAPAQIWRENMDTATCTTMDARREEGGSQSQWRGTVEAEDGERLTMDTQSIDEETQFLDANGY